MVTEQKQIENDGRVLAWSTFHETLDFFNDALGRPCVLGGGCIRDTWVSGPDLIKDYDVWVLGVKESEIRDLDNLLAESAHSAMQHYTHEIGMGSVATKAACIDYPNRKFHAPKSNMLLPWVPGGKQTQIMYTPEETMADLVAKFDWRACSFGFDGEVVISDGESDFAVKTLTLNDTVIPLPRSTLRRGFHLEDKFRGTPHKLKMLNETILALAAMLTLSGEKQP